MKTMKYRMLAALLLLGSASVAMAQAVDNKNKKEVKRILFDRENISVVYDDDTMTRNVESVFMARDKGAVVDIDLLKKADSAKEEWYTLDGRKLQGAPQDRGVYVKKTGNRVCKTIKK